MSDADQEVRALPLGPVELADAALDAGEASAGDDGVGDLASHLGDQLDVFLSEHSRAVRLHAEDSDHPLVAAGRHAHIRPGMRRLLPHQAPKRDARRHEIGDAERLVGVEHPLGETPRILGPGRDGEAVPFDYREPQPVGFGYGERDHIRSDGVAGRLESDPHHLIRGVSA